MGDPMAPSDSEGNSEGGGRARWFASRKAKRAGITRPQLFEMSPAQRAAGAPAERKGTIVQICDDPVPFGQQPVNS